MDYEIFQEMNRIIEYYDMETEDGSTVEWFTHTERNDRIHYIVEDDNEHCYEVEGELIKEGLAIHPKRLGVGQLITSPQPL